jgi:hypothetical protein
MVNRKSQTKEQTVEIANIVNEREQLTRASFKPYLEDGYARLTFTGLEHVDIDYKNGEGETPRMLFGFSCLDVSWEHPKVLGLQADYVFSPDTKFGQLVQLLGYEIPVETNTQKKRFNKKLKYDMTDIFNFIRSKCGYVYTAKLYNPRFKNKETGEYLTDPDTGEILVRKFIWNIDFKTLEPLTDENGLQERDWLASDVTDEAFNKVETDMITNVES